MTKSEAINVLAFWLDKVPSGRISIIKKRGGEYHVSTEEDLHSTEDARRVFRYDGSAELLNNLNNI